MKNSERASLALDALAAGAFYSELDDDLETAIGDLIANLKHLCGQRGIDFDDCVVSGNLHYTSEYEGDDLMDAGDQDEPGRCFLDANDQKYPSDMLYYQPYEFVPDVNGKTWPTKTVWRTETECQALFPTSQIGTFSGNMIERPIFAETVEQ